MIWTTWCLFGILIGITIYFCVWDIKYRMIPTKHVYACMGVALPFVVLEWVFNYIPNYGLMTVFWAVVGVIIPFVWYFFMRRYIGEQDVRWLAFVFVALPLHLITVIAFMIVFILITFAVFKIKKSKEMLPAMIPIGLSLVTQMVFCII